MLTIFSRKRDVGGRNAEGSRIGLGVSILRDRQEGGGQGWYLNESETRAR
jgi:hypothetical protein